MECVSTKAVDRFFTTDFPKGQIVKLPPVVPATPPLDWPKDAPKLNARVWNHVLMGIRTNMPEGAVPYEF